MIAVRRQETRPSSGRYIVSIDGVDAGYTMYGFDEGIVTFKHTEVDPAFEGKGVGSALARGALDDVRARGYRVRALCPFIAAYLERHPQDHDIVVA